MGPTDNSAERPLSTIEHDPYPQTTTLPPVSLLPNFESARQSPTEESRERQGVPSYPVSREGISHDHAGSNGK